MPTIMRRGVAVFVLVVAVVLTAAPASRAQTGTPVVFLDGKGFGHGVGLAQWGAMHLAEAGASHQDILSTFYPGTALATVADEDVRVAVFTSPNGQATLTFPNGGEVRSSPTGDQAPGFPVTVGPGGAVVVSYDGAYHVTPAVTTQAAGTPVAWQAPADNCLLPGITCPPPSGGGCLTCTTTTPPTTAAPPPDSSSPGSTDPAPPPSDTSPPPPAGPTVSGPASSGAPVWAVANDGGVTGVAERGRHYRGVLEATAGGGPLRLVNQVDVETYLRGMGEVPSTWPIESIAAQTVAARTYALRAMAFSGELCDYDLCQVYIGADRETQGQNAAVAETAGEVLTYGGALASTVYSADAGGVTATTLEGFGSPDGVYPYLTVVHYDTPDPLPWRTEVALSDVASRFGYAGTVTNVVIGQAGPSGRALQVTLDGSNGPMSVDGRAFAAHLGLRSTLFQPTIGTDDNPPPPPGEGSGLQALPDDAAALRAAALAGQQAVADDAAALRGMQNWASSLASGLHLPKARDLATSPAVWSALALAVLVTAYALGALGFPPPPLALQLADRPPWRPSRFDRAGGRRTTRSARKTPSAPAEDAAVAGDEWTSLFDGVDPPPDAERPAPKDRPFVKLRLRRAEG